MRKLILSFSSLIHRKFFPLQWKSNIVPQYNRFDFAIFYELYKQNLNAKSDLTGGFDNPG